MNLQGLFIGKPDTAQQSYALATGQSLAAATRRRARLLNAFRIVRHRTFRLHNVWHASDQSPWALWC